MEGEVKIISWKFTTLQQLISLSSTLLCATTTQLIKRHNKNGSPEQWFFFEETRADKSNKWKVWEKSDNNDMEWPSFQIGF